MNNAQLRQFVNESAIDLGCYLLNRRLDPKEEKVVTALQDSLDIIDDLRHRLYGKNVAGRMVVFHRLIRKCADWLRGKQSKPLTHRC